MTEILKIGQYFYEVLMPEFMRIEEKFDSVKKLNGLFKKIDYSYRDVELHNLLIEIENQKQKLISIETDDCVSKEFFNCLYNTIIILIKLSENLYLTNNKLASKAKGYEYRWKEYKHDYKKYYQLRDDMENLLPILQRHYAIEHYRAGQ